MHIYQTDGKGHGTREVVPDTIDIEDITIDGSSSDATDFSDKQAIENARRLDTYTGRTFDGVRGIMIHLGQKAGENNIPEDVTDIHDGQDFPIVKVDDFGNIVELIQPGGESAPPADPFLPWNHDSTTKDEDYIHKDKIKAFVKELREGSGAATAESIEQRFLDL